MNQEHQFRQEGYSITNIRTKLIFGISLHVQVIKIPDIIMLALLRVAYTDLSILVKHRGAHDRPLGKQVN